MLKVFLDLPIILLKSIEIFEHWEKWLKELILGLFFLSFYFWLYLTLFMLLLLDIIDLRINSESIG